MVNKLVGLVLALIPVAFYGYWYFNPNFEADWTFWGKAALGGVSGLGILVYEFRNIFSHKKENVDIQVDIPDLKLVNMLKKRLLELKSKEGLKHLQEINNILFKIDIE